MANDENKAPQGSSILGSLLGDAVRDAASQVADQVVIEALNLLKSAELSLTAHTWGFRLYIDGEPIGKIGWEQDGKNILETSVRDELDFHEHLENPVLYREFAQKLRQVAQMIDDAFQRLE